MKKYLICVVAALCFCCSFSAWAKDLDEELLSLQREFQKVLTVQSVFVQEKQLSMFEDVVRSEGQFFFKAPDGLRWEYQKPFQAGFLLRGAQGYRWNAVTGQQEEFTAKDSPGTRELARQLLMWMRLDKEALSAQYTIHRVQEVPLVLRLVSKNAAARRFLQETEVHFSREKPCLTQVILREAGGDVTSIRFTGTVLDAPLADSIFRP